MKKGKGKRVQQCEFFSFKFFYATEILKENPARKKLTVIIDNCGGQKNNNFVLRLSALFVELGFYDKVNFVFYIVGYTNNACDRWFNNLKRKYRKSNLYSYDELLKCMETHKNITEKCRK
jgi:hypothetical protein